MKRIAILITFLVYSAAIAATNHQIEPIYLEEQGLHCFTDIDYQLVLGKIVDGKTAKADIESYKVIIEAQKSLIKRYRIKSGLSIAGGVSALAGSALLLSGQENLKKYGAGIAVFGLVSVSVGLAW